MASLCLPSRMRNPPSPGVFPFAFGGDRATSASQVLGNRNASRRRKGSAEVTKKRRMSSIWGAVLRTSVTPTDGQMEGAHYTEVASGEITSVLCRNLKNQNLKRKGKPHVLLRAARHLLILNVLFF